MSKNEILETDAKTRVKALLSALSYPAVYIGTVVLLSIIFMIFSYDHKNGDVQKIDMGGSSVVIILIATVITLGGFVSKFRARKQNFFEELKITNISVKSYLFSAILGGSLNIFIVFVLYIMNEWIYFKNIIESSTKILESSILTVDVIVILIGVGVISPFFEEVLYRGFVLGDLKRNFPINRAIFIQALIFSILHGDVLQSTYTFILGMILGNLRVKTNSLTVPIVAHISFNFVNLRLFIYSSVREPESIVLKVLIALIMLCLVIYSGKVILRDNKEKICNDDLGSGV